MTPGEPFAILHGMRIRFPHGRRWATCVAAAALVGCTTTPYTNRSQIMLISPEQEMKLGATAFQQVKKESSIVAKPTVSGAVADVGRRIAAVADRPDYRWEFVVIDDPKTPNAFALPGGKVAVYTGLFPIAKTTSGLAVVMGHEVAHALARHGAERASQSMLAKTGGAILGAAVATQSPGSAQAAMAVYGLGTQVGVLLPWSRTQESEADHIGLLLMAKAGYDPREALDFWQRMSQAGGKKTSDFLSTHPGHETRQSDIQRWLPEAIEIYERSAKAPVEPLPGAAVASSSR